MPVKVRCRKCENVFAAPDRARGKAIRCPECRAPVKVPAGKRKPGTATDSAAGTDDETVFSSLDLSQAEDRTARLCPKCAAEVSTDEKTCPHCHVDLQTGVVSSRMQKRLKRKGPNPALFYKAAWGDSWNFMLSNQRLAIQTWIVNIIVVLMQTAMVFAGFWKTINGLGEVLFGELQQIAARSRVPVRFQHHGSRFGIIFGTREPVTNYQQALVHDPELMLEFCRQTTRRGVYFHDYGGGPCHHGYSLAHSLPDIHQALSVIDDSLQAMG